MRRVAGAGTGALLLGVLLAGPMAASSLSATPSQCTRSQLIVGVAEYGVNGGCAAGTCGIDYLIANKGPHACTLDGFASLRVYTGGKPPKPIRIVHSGGFWAAEKPRLVTIPVHGNGSFGLSIGDATNQGMGNRAACDVQQIYVTLPVSREGLNESFETTPSFNVCFFAFTISETPIESGPEPAPA